MKRLLFVCILLVGCLVAGRAQQIVFRNYSVADGLPSSTVRAIAQDHQGYLWFATKNGLSRFDGYQFKSFQHNAAIPNSIGNNFIHCITVFDSTHLWVGTENSFFILDLETEQFVQFEPLKGKTIFDIYKDSDGRVWITTRFNGLFRYHPESRQLEQFVADGREGSISRNEVTKIAADLNGNIWVGTYGGGINIYEKDTERFRVISAGEMGLENNYINNLYRGRDGSIWAGTMNGGLYHYLPGENRFVKYSRDGSRRAIQDNIVRAIYQDAAGLVYIGTEKGLSILDLNTDETRSFGHNSNDPFSISDNAVYCIAPDRAGTLWVGTFFGGVNYFPEKGAAFNLYYPTGDAGTLKGRAVSSFLEDAPGRFWVGTEDGGLHYFNARTGVFQQYPFKAGQQPLSYHNIHSLTRDDQGRIWIGIFAGGVNVLDPATGRVKVYGHLPSDKYSLNSNNIFSIYRDREQKIWVGTDKGLNLYDPEKDRFIRIDEEGLNNTIVYDVYEDASKTIWVATYNHGLFKYHKKTGEWVRFNLNAKLTSLCDDNNGNLWIGSDGAGLFRFNFRSRQLEAYSQIIGLPANVVFGVQRDDAGLIWASTNNGIYSIDPVAEKLRHFTRQDNLQSQQFNYRAFYKASDGMLMAGGIKGFNTFYPERISQQESLPTVSFTNFQLFNKTVQPGEKSPLQKQINYTGRIELDHDQTVIGIEFAALNSSTPEKLQYAYKLDGFDQNWNYVQEQRKATYTNLSPGQYVFRVKATAAEGSWDMPESTLTLVIHPPFYKTTLAYIIYLLLAAALSYGIYRYSAAYIRRQNQIRLERLKNKEEQAFYARKIEFFTVMAHEIRTPLSLIIAPLEKLLASNSMQGEEREQLSVMDENAERLMGLVNQLLDFRRIESDAYEIRKEEMEIVSAVQAIYSRFSAIPYQKNIEFRLSTSISSRMVEADPEVVDKILSNLLINAFKFARSRVAMSVQIEHHAPAAQDFLCISVEDDGIGIPEENIRNIFTKFFTTAKGNHEYHNLGGSGIGLALASSLAEKHGARISVKSEEGVRTIFRLELPLSEARAASLSTTVSSHISEPETANRPGLPTVLLVEDDLAIRDFLKQRFHAEGYNTETASNGREAMKILEDGEVDLIISDWMMTEMDGVEFCRELKSDLSYSHIPFVMLTARGSREAEILGIETGADAFIMKPFKWKHLVAVARNLTESREQLRRKYAEQPQSEVTVLATNSQDKEFMESVVKIIEERIMDSQFSVEELSRELAMSRSTLHKKLKSLSGYVPNELIKLVKLKHAARLLLAGSNTVTEVAYLSGFNSPSYFSKCFQQQFRVSPKEFADKSSGKTTLDIGIDENLSGEV